MAFNYFENTVLVDDWLVSFDKVPQAADKENVVRRVTKRWEEVKSDVDGLGGLKLQKPDFQSVADTLIKSGSHAVMFELVLSKTEFRLDLLVGNVTMKVGTTRLPSDLEEYRSFLGTLNGWSTSGRDIVPDGAFKDFNAKNPKKPTEYKDYDEMVKKSKTDEAAFRTWAKTNATAKKAFADIDKTAKAKPTDAARVAAMKAINASLKDYYKSF